MDKVVRTLSKRHAEKARPRYRLINRITLIVGPTLLIWLAIFAVLKMMGTI